jgi:hypothetical protein
MRTGAPRCDAESEHRIGDGQESGDVRPTMHPGRAVFLGRMDAALMKVPHHLAPPGVGLLESPAVTACILLHLQDRRIASAWRFQSSHIP